MSPPGPISILLGRAFLYFFVAFGHCFRIGYAATAIGFALFGLAVGNLGYFLTGIVLCFSASASWRVTKLAIHGLRKDLRRLKDNGAEPPAQTIA